MYSPSADSSRLMQPRTGIGDDRSVDHLVPSAQVVDARAALRIMLPGATWLHGAVAFATQSGVELLQRVFDDVGAPETVRIVVRGAPITEPQAVLALDQLGADVRVVIGADAARFHPKLWVARTPKETWVLSGSGNLTAGGMRDNDEQFELFRLEHHSTALSGRSSGSNEAASDHLSRWRGFFDQGLPLGQARTSPGWAEWEAQLDRRAELRAQIDRLDRALVDASLTAGGGVSNGGDGSELALSATTERPTIERWMRRWYPDEAVRMTVWNLLADAMQAAHAHRRYGWAACAVHWSGHDDQPRLVVLCGVSQVFVVHSKRGVFFEGPPAHRDAAGHAAAMRAASPAGAMVEEWGEGDNRHPSVLVPAPAAVEAADVGGRDAVTATIRWRSPGIEDGKAGHAQHHCPALVDAARRATHRDLAPPAYSLSV